MAVGVGLEDVADRHAPSRRTSSPPSVTLAWTAERSPTGRDECTPELFRALRADEEERPDDHQERRDESRRPSRRRPLGGRAPSGFLPYQ